jgi:hypothetical protein
MIGRTEWFLMDELQHVPGERRPLTAQERQALRARSQQLRAQAAEAVTRCSTLRVAHAAQADRLQTQCDALGELRARLCQLVGDYSVAARRLELAPEGALILVKETLRDPIRRLSADVQRELWDDVAWWTVESYFAA